MFETIICVLICFDPELSLCAWLRSSLNHNASQICSGFPIVNFLPCLLILYVTTSVVFVTSDQMLRSQGLFGSCLLLGQSLWLQQFSWRKLWISQSLNHALRITEETRLSFCLWDMSQSCCVLNDTQQWFYSFWLLNFLTSEWLWSKSLFYYLLHSDQNTSF